MEFLAIMFWLLFFIVMIPFIFNSVSTFVDDASEPGRTYRKYRRRNKHYGVDMEE